MHLVAMSADAHEKVVRLDIAMYKVLHVNVLDSANHLIGQHQYCLQREPVEARYMIPKAGRKEHQHAPSRAEIEEILQRRTEQVHNEDIVLAFRTVPSAQQSLMPMEEEERTAYSECPHRPRESCTLCSRTTIVDDDSAAPPA